MDDQEQVPGKPWYEKVPKKEVRNYLAEKETSRGRFNWRATKGINECADSSKIAITILLVVFLVVLGVSALLDLEDTHWPLAMMASAGAAPAALALGLSFPALLAAIKDFQKYQEVRDYLIATTIEKSAE